MGEQADHLRIGNEVLELVTTLAVGRDRNDTIELRSLPVADLLSEALAAHFEACTDPRNGKVSPAAWWHSDLRDLRPLDGEPGPAVVPLVDEWLFTEPWARAPVSAPEDVGSEAANHVASLVLATVGDGAAVHDVRASPPLWHDTCWRDVAIEGANGRYLLGAQFDD